VFNSKWGNLIKGSGLFVLKGSGRGSFAVKHFYNVCENLIQNAKIQVIDEETYPDPS